MDASRELDARIAERVMGLPRDQVRYSSEGREWITEQLPLYSTDITAAWQVIEYLSARGVWLYKLCSRRETIWRCIFAQGKGYDIVYAQSRGETTAPLAICNAALAAVAGEG